ncbi:MAG: hypothetical protein LBJ72_05140 [Dysgonamonadaceae bacterium]|jgi:hypothetical protein|nr:hypothetical protein [Dysgonamonadaceae bacterium]
MKKELLKQGFNSVQLNIVAFVDVQKAIALKTLEGCIYMMDNSPMSTGQGTSRLQTTCKQGQTLNWIIYAMDSEKKPDGSWPPSVRINNIVFTDKESQDVSTSLICENLRIYGAPDKIRSNYTPVYYYWAGTVPLDLSPGKYRYRLILELENEKTDKCEYLNLETPVLNVISIKIA